MDNKKFKPIKKWDVMATYILGAIAQLLTIIFWFLPTGSVEAWSSRVVVYDSNVYFFSGASVLPAGTLIINYAMLLLSVASLILMVLPLVTKTVMKPRKIFIFSAIVNFIYLLLFVLRFFSASSMSYVDFSLGFVGIVYFVAIAMSFGAALGLLIGYSKPKRQWNNSDN